MVGLITFVPKEQDFYLFLFFCSERKRRKCIKIQTYIHKDTSTTNFFLLFQDAAEKDVASQFVSVSSFLITSFCSLCCVHEHVS